MEPDARNYYSSPYYLLPTVGISAYTSGIYGNYYIFAPYAQGILIDEEEAENITYNTFLSTSDDAFSKVSMENIENFEKAEEDMEGPFAIGVEAVKTLEEGEAVLVVYGCEQLFTDNANAMVSGANQMLFINTISSFVDHEVSISIPVKEYEVSMLIISQSGILLWAPFVTVILPAGFLVVGFVIWFRRRRR